MALGLGIIESTSSEVVSLFLFYYVALAHWIRLDLILISFFMLLYYQAIDDGDIEFVLSYFKKHNKDEVLDEIYGERTRPTWFFY